MSRELELGRVTGEMLQFHTLGCGLTTKDIDKYYVNYKGIVRICNDEQEALEILNAIVAERTKELKEDE